MDGAAGGGVIIVVVVGNTDGAGVVVGVVVGSVVVVVGNGGLSSIAPGTKSLLESATILNPFVLSIMLCTIPENCGVKTLRFVGDVCKKVINFSAKSNLFWE